MAENGNNIVQKLFLGLVLFLTTTTATVVGWTVVQINALTGNIEQKVNYDELEALRSTVVDNNTAIWQAHLQLQTELTQQLAVLQTMVSQIKEQLDAQAH